MEAFHGDTWQLSPQVQALLKASKIGTVGLNYLKGHQGYTDARLNNEILEGYADNDAELSRDLHALEQSAKEERVRRAAAQRQAKEDALAAQPHLAYAQLVEERFPNRQVAPLHHEEHPPTDAFAIGDRVVLPGNVEAMIVAYPDLRSHPAEVKKTKWVVGYVNAAGTMIVEERKQADIVKA
jgi:hypothetical protein